MRPLPLPRADHSPQVPLGTSCERFTTEDTEPTEEGAWINVVRPSRRPLRGLLRVRTLLNPINGSPHAEERSQSASRSTRRHRCSLSCSRCVLIRYQQLAGLSDADLWGKISPRSLLPESSAGSGASSSCQGDRCPSFSGLPAIARPITSLRQLGNGTRLILYACMLQCAHTEADGSAPCKGDHIHDDRCSDRH